MRLTIKIIPILFDIPNNIFVIKGKSAPAFINWFTTFGKTNANRDIITTIEKEEIFYFFCFFFCTYTINITKK